MSIALEDVLDDPTIVAAEPVVLAGRSHLRRPVTWVHTSEVLEIASLLRGGELLLVGGVSLVTATRQERVAYVHELADRGVAGIAIETGSRLRDVPHEMVEEADRLDLPLIQLRRVVRFVEVTQAINSLLVNESVRRLQLADQISHALAIGLADGAELPELMEILAAEAQADTRLTARNGEVLAEVRIAPDEPVTLAGVAQPIVAPVNSAGMTVAHLTLTPRPGTNLMLLDAAVDRAPESLGLAMLRYRPLSRVERDTHELIVLAGAEEGHSPRRLTEVATRLGITAHDAWVTTVARTVPGQPFATVIEAALAGPGRTVISQIDEDLHTCIIALRLTGTTLAAARQGIISDLRTVALPSHMTVAVGPGARSLARIPHCLRESKATLDLTEELHPGVSDSVALGVARLVAALDRDDLVSAFIDEQIGDLIAVDEQRQSRLVDTLGAYLRHSGNKTETAAALHLQRQSLYQRLERIMTILGHPTAGTGRWAAIILACELDSARRHVAAEEGGFMPVRGRVVHGRPPQARPRGAR